MTAINIRGRTLAYDINAATASPAVVWGHGLNGSCLASDEFPLVDLARLRARHQVLRYDAHGHGESDVLSVPERGSWAELALDQLALIDQLDLGEHKVTVGGVSMGAGTALHSALSLGNRLHKLVLVIPPTGWSERAKQTAVYEQMAAIIDAGRVEVLVTANSSVAPPDPFVGDPDWRERSARMFRSTDPVRLASNFRGAAFADLPSLEQIASITAPTLVLAWSGDPGHPVSTAGTLGNSMQNVDVHVSSTREEFDTWTDRCLAFLEDSA